MRKISHKHLNNSDVFALRNGFKNHPYSARRFHQRILRWKNLRTLNEVNFWIWIHHYSPDLVTFLASPPIHHLPCNQNPRQNKNVHVIVYWANLFSMNFSTMTLHSEESFFFYLNKFYYVISYLETETTKQWPAISWYESISCISLIRVRLT